MTRWQGFGKGSLLSGSAIYRRFVAPHTRGRRIDLNAVYIQSEAAAPALQVNRARNHPQPKLAAEEPYPFAAFDPLLPATPLCLCRVLSVFPYSAAVFCPI